MSARPRQAALGSLLLTLATLVSGGSCTSPAGDPPLGGLSPQVTVESDAEILTFLTPSIPEAYLEPLQAELPGLRLLVGLSREEILELAPEVDGIDGRYCSPEFLGAATQLTWVQATSAGVERYLAIAELRDNDRIVLTNMQGVHGPTIADHVFGMLLTLTRDLRYYTHPDQQGAWNRAGSGARRIALQDQTMFVVGLGGIGREVACRAKGFGMRVIATRRSEAPPPPYVDRQGLADDLDAFLAEADVVVLCVPLTDETRGMIGREAFALLKDGAYLVNVARGKVVDTDALVDALRSGRLAGACLDVTDPEPLPPDHPLWRFPNVVITPHVSSRSELTEDRRWELYAENLRRFAAGEPLRNVVDKQAGY